MDIPQAVKEIHFISTGNIGQILFIILLTFFNAFLTSAEVAIISLDSEKLREEAEDGDRKSKKLLKLLDNQTKFLTTTKIIVNLIAIFVAQRVSVGISLDLGQNLNSVGLPYPFIISQIIFTLILTFLIIIVGELVPKRLSLDHSKKIARFSVGIISFLQFIFTPFVIIIDGFTNLILKIFGVELSDLEGKITINDIKSMVQLGQSQGVIDSIEGDMINSVMEFDEITAEEIMTPRTEVFMIDINDEPKEYIDEMISMKYSRIPVYNEDVDKIVGILYLKDYLLESYKVGFENVNIKNVIKPAYFVPKRKNVNELFADMQRKNKHMALLVDEYGGFAGLVTMEDLIEEIMGNIDDEYDFDEPELVEISEGEYKVKASMSIKEFNNQTNLELDEDNEAFDTIGGYIINNLGYIPEDGDTPYLENENVSMQVLEVKDKRIVEVNITKVENVEEINE